MNLFSADIWSSLLGFCVATFNASEVSLGGFIFISLSSIVLHVSQIGIFVLFSRCSCVSDSHPHQCRLLCFVIWYLVPEFYVYFSISHNLLLFVVLELFVQFSFNLSDINIIISSIDIGKNHFRFYQYTSVLYFDTSKF